MAAYTNPALQQGNMAPGNPNTPTHVEGGYGDVFILGSTLLADNPQLLPDYFKQAGYPITTLAKIKSFQFGRLNLNRAVEGPVTGHYEKPRPNNVLTLGAGATTVNATTVRIQLTADEMDNEVDYAGNAVRYSRPRVSEVWSLGNGSKYRIIAKDDTVNPHTITLQAGNGAIAATEIVAGAKMFYVGTVKGEATGQVSSLRNRQYKYQNTFWICDETHIVSGTNMTTAVQFKPVPGSNLLYLEGVKDAEMRHELQKGMIWMFGSKAANWTDFSTPLKATVPIAGTQGFLDGALENGFDFEYDPNDFTEDDLYEITSYYHDIRVGTNELMMFEGNGVNKRLEIALKDRINYTWVAGVSDRYMADQMRNAKSLDSEFDPEGMFINLGIKGLSLNNFTILQTEASEFSNFQGAGAVGYKDVFIVAPFGKAGNADNTPYIGYEWRGTEGYSRENEVWINGGAGPDRVVTKSSEFDVRNTYMRSEIAPHFALLDEFVVGSPVGQF